MKRFLIMIMILLAPYCFMQAKKDYHVFQGIYLGIPKSVFMKKVNRIINYQICYNASYGRECDLLQIHKFENYCRFKNNKLERLVFITPFDYKKRGDNTHDTEESYYDNAFKRLSNHLKKVLGKDLSFKMKAFSRDQYSAEYRIVIWIDKK